MIVEYSFIKRLSQNYPYEDESSNYHGQYIPLGQSAVHFRMSTGHSHKPFTTRSRGHGRPRCPWQLLHTQSCRVIFG